MSQDPLLLHQILFCWTERSLTGSSGVGPALSSLRSGTELAHWEQRLLAADWAAAAVAGGSTQPALVYLRFADQAVIMRKETVTDPHGRGGSPLTHVLIGHESVLGASVALGLHDWTGWISTDSIPAELGVLDGARLRLAAEAGYRTLRGRAQQLNHHLLAALVAAVLSDPSGRFSVYPPDDPELLAAAGALVPAAELMCGVLDVLGEIGGQPWTFSTGEAKEPATASRPRVVFLRKAQGFTTRGATGHHVTIGQFAWRAGKADPENEIRLHDFGIALADGYSRMGPSVIDPRRPVKPIRTLADAIAWSSTAQIMPGVLDNFEYLLLAIGDNRLDPARVAAFQDEPGRFDKQIAAMSGEVLGELASGWSPGTLAAEAYPGIAQAIRQEAAWRYVSDGRAPDRGTALALGAEPKAWIDQLSRYRAERGPGGLLDAARRVAPLVPSTADGELAALLADLPPAELLVLAHEWAAAWPALSAQLLTAVADRYTITEPQRADCRERLEELGFLVAAIERCYPHDPRSAGRLFARLLSRIYAAELQQPGTIERMIHQIAGIRSAPLLWGLADTVPGRLRSQVLSAAGNLWFEDNDLQRLSTDVMAPAEAPAAPPAPQATGSAARDIHAGGETAVPAKQLPERRQPGPWGLAGLRLVILTGVAFLVVIIVIALLLFVLDGLKI